MDKRVKFYLFIQRKLRGKKIQKAEEMEYTIPSDYQSLILSVGYYSTVRIFGRTSRKHTVDAYAPYPHSSFQIYIYINIKCLLLRRVKREDQINWHYATLGW